MITWCAYCQQFSGEKEVYTDYSVSHGICQACYEKDAFIGAIPERTKVLVAFYEKLRHTAAAGDLNTVENLAREAIDSGFELLDVAVGFIQPALYEVGEKWAKNEITHHDEHRFTAWANRWMEMVTPSIVPLKEQPDLLIVQGPGNVHTLGPSLAAMALRRLGFDVRFHNELYTTVDLGNLLKAMAPRRVGFSCALPGMVTRAIVVAETLRQGGYGGEVLISGVAIRGPKPRDMPEGFLAPRCIEEAGEILSQDLLPSS